jgi:putative photosynthetic complex assembly protein
MHAAPQLPERIMTEQQHSHEVRVPLGILVAAAVLISLTIAAVAVFRIAGVDPVAQVPDPTDTVETRQLRFEDRSDGSVAVYEYNDRAPDRLVHVVDSGAGGFIRGVLRSMTRARRAGGFGQEHPFLLSLEANGRLFLEDTATEQRIYLQAFGPTNVESFRAMLYSEGLQQ